LEFFLHDIIGCKSDNHKGDVPHHGRSPSTVESANALLLENSLARLSKAAVHTRH
jgi:hypothetical protein